jgi:adenosine deaminase
VRGIKRGLKFGERELGITHLLILSFVRDLPEEQAYRTFDMVRAHPIEIDAIDLASNELGNPPRKFRMLFKKAKEEGYRLIMHAGEEGPVSYIWEAVTDIGVDRINHGLRAIDDPSLISFLQRAQTPIVMSPISNVKLGCVPSLREHPLAKMYRAGLFVSISTDDPGLLQCDLAQNYGAVAGELSLTAQELMALAEHSIVSSFAQASRKAHLVKELRELCPPLARFEGVRDISAPSL